MFVNPIGFTEVRDWLLHRHYAQRIPSVSYAFGLFDCGVLVGVVTYGTPSSSTLRAGVAGSDNAELVLELNRLCLLHNGKNHASKLVGRSLRMLPRPSVVVSYADQSVGHVGYVYQACNFIYTGLSAKRTDWRVEGLDHLHGQTIADKVRNAEGRRVDAMRAMYGDRFSLVERARKHRYVYICAKNNRQKSELAAALRYQPQPYPKGVTVNTASDYTPSTQCAFDF